MTRPGRPHWNIRVRGLMWQIILCNSHHAHILLVVPPTLVLCYLWNRWEGDAGASEELQVTVDSKLIFGAQEGQDPTCFTKSEPTTDTTAAQLCSKMHKSHSFVNKKNVMLAPLKHILLGLMVLLATYESLHTTGPPLVMIMGPVS